MSSIQASYDTYLHRGARAKRRHKPKPPHPQPPFRFRDLPLEIRNEIYHFCLADLSRTAIEPVEGYEVDYTEMTKTLKMITLFSSYRVAPAGRQTRARQLGASTCS